MATTSSAPRVFRVFVSSTFDDLVAERDALQRGVVVDGELREGAFVRLRRLCEAHGARFQAIDLRWGVSEEAAYDQRTVPLCLAEVERCRRLSPRPSFLAILGDRYGWRPLPWTLALDEWETAQATLTGPDLDLVRQWYRRDDNQVPPVAVLQPREGESRDPQAWQDVEARLRTALEQVTPRALSATEQEMRAGVLLDPAGSGAGFAFLRTIDGLPDDAPAAPYVDIVDGRPDADAAASVAALRTQLREQLGERVHEYTARWEDGAISTDHLAQLNDDVYDALAGSIETELAQLEALDPLDVERETHARFAADRCAHLVGRADVLATIAARRAQANRPVVVWGAAGSGKSAILAATGRAATNGEPAAVVVCRFVGATPASSVGPQLLRSIWAEIDREYGVAGPGAPGDDTVLLSRFPEQLRLATAERPLLVLIDGLDQLPDHDPVRRLTWLPDYLPQHAWVAVSTRPGAELDRLRGRLDADQVVEVPGLSPEEGAELLDHWLGSGGRTLQADQAAAVLTAFESSGGLPLHLRLSAEEARSWPSWYEPPPLPVDVPSLIDLLFARLAREDNHGAVLVGRALGLLAASRDGLTEDELLDLLSADPEVMSDFVRRSPRSPAVERLPVVVWSRLFADLESYLTARSADGTVTIVFYHRELADASARAFLSGDENAARHAQLAAYFSGQWQQRSTVTPLRALAELPFHLARTGQLEAATDLVTDPDFVASKVRAGGLPSMLEDLDELERQGGDDPALPILREALTLSIEALTRDRDQLAGQLIGRLGLVADGRIHRLVDGLAGTARGPWLRPTTASLTPPGEPLVRILRGRFDPASAVAFSADGLLVAAGSYERDLRVWDLATGLEVVHATGQRPGGSQAEGAGGDEIVDLRFTDAGLVAASADRCVYAVDLRSGVARMVVTGETDNLYALAIVDEHQVLSAPRSVWGLGATTLQVWSLDDGQAHDVPGLEGSCEHLAVSGDGGTALSVSRDGPVVRWDLRAGTADERWTLAGTSALALSPDGGTRAIATADGTIVVGGPGGDRTLSGHHGSVRALVFARPELLVSAGADGTVRLWDLGVGRELRCLRGHGTGLSSVAVSADARRILSGGDDGAVHVWDLGREPIAVSGRPPQVHAAAVVAAAVGDDGETGATLAADDSVLRWDLGTSASVSVAAQPAELDHVAGRTPVPEALMARAAALDEEAPRSASDATHTVTAVAVSADGRRAITASTDNIMVFYRLNVTRDEARVRLWDLASGSRIRVLSFREESGVSYSRTEACRCAAVDATGTYGCTGGDDRTLQVWHLDSGTRVAALTLDAPATACALSPDGTALLAGDAAGRVHLLRLELGGWTPAPTATAAGGPVAVDPQSGERWGGSLRRTGGALVSDQGWVESVAVSPDGERALVAGADGSVVRWNLVDRRHEPLEPAHADWACAVGFSVDGRLAASGSADGTVRLWEPATGGLVDTLTNVPGGAWSLLGLPDGRRWLVGDGDGGLLLWEPRAGAPPTRIPVHGGAVTALVLLGGSSVASASVDGSLAVTDTRAGTVTWRSSSGTPIWSLALVGGDVCAGRATALETWDVVTGHLRWSLETGHRTAITAVAATPDGERVVTGSVDGEVRITDTNAGRPLGLVLRTGWPVNAVAITPDGESALVAGHGGDVHVVPLAEESEAVEDSIRARFTDAEWDVVRRLPGIVSSFVAGADGKVTREEALQMHPPAEHHLPTGTAARDFGALMVAQPAIEWIVESGTLQDPAAPRYDGDFGLSRAILRRRLCDQEYREVVEVLLAAAREVAAQSRHLVGNDVSREEEEALRAMAERF